MRPDELARRLAAIADDKKATELVALDVRALVSYTDYLVICTAGTSGRRRRSTTRSTTS